MDLIGRLACYMGAAIVIGKLQSMFETWAGPEWTISLYGFLVFMAFWLPIGWLIFHDKKPAPTPAPGSGAGGER